MKSRHIPFGYRIRQGEIEGHPQEAGAVRQIFQAYLNGDGYTTITRRLAEGDVPYRQGVEWNKHMVKRILENRRYCGEQGYPALISTADFDAVATKRAGKPQSVSRPRPPKAPPPVYRILPYQPTAKVLRLTNEINRALERRPKSEEIHPLIFSLAAEKYASIGVTVNE